MTTKNFKARVGVETPLIAAENGTTAITLSSADVVVAGDLTVQGNDIKNSIGTTVISMINGALGDVSIAGDLQVSGNEIKDGSSVSSIFFPNGNGDVTIARDLFVQGNEIFSLGGNRNLTFSGTDVEVEGDLTVRGGDLTLNNTTSGTFKLTAPATGTQAYTLPSAYPVSSGQVLASTTGGVMSWATASGGSSPLKVGEPPPGGNFDYSIPGFTPLTSVATSWAQAAQRVVYQAIYVQETISLSSVAIYVSTATSLASCNAMIYIDTVDPNATTHWQPTGHLSGGYCGEVPITSTGLKTITMGSAISLSPGYYLVVIQLSNYTGTLNIASSVGRITSGLAYTLDKSTASLSIADAWQRNGVAYTSGTPAAIGNWTPTFNGSAGQRCPVLLLWTV